MNKEQNALFCINKRNKTVFMNALNLKKKVCPQMNRTMEQKHHL